jgi:hypothetical protein
MDMIPLRGSVRKHLDQFLQETHGTRGIAAIPPGGTSCLFTDASLQGWGAVLITSDQRVFIAGERWSEKVRVDSTNINVLEARAVDLALNSFADLLHSLPDTKLSIVVDNTSTLAGLRRGTARAPLVNLALVPAIEKLTAQNQFAIALRYVKSKENPADAPSRQQELDIDAALDLATRLDDERRGGGESLIAGRTFASSVSPVTSVVSPIANSI